MTYYVAKTYQNLETVGDVFNVSDKLYINVKLKNGKIKAVRAYSLKEYNKMYPNDKKVDRYYKTQKEVLGFKNGYITIFKGDAVPHTEWFRKSIAKKTRLWGWYIASTDEIPKDLPQGLEPVRLNWADVGENDEILKSDKEVCAVVDSLIYISTGSEYVGEIGERLELKVTIEKNYECNNGAIMHTMRDENGNIFLWTTNSKNWAVGSKHVIRGTVKDHRKYKGEKQTVLTRCFTVGQT